MSFKRGPQYKVFITTENPEGAVGCTGDLASASSVSGFGVNSTTKGVGMLGEFTASTDASHEFKNVEGIEPVWRWEDDPFTVFGQTRPLDNPIRKSWELTITKKGEDKTLALLADGARFGVTGSGASAALFDGLDTMPNTTGYRLYVWDGASYYIGYHGTITPDGYKETLSPTGVTVQACTFHGGRWSSSVTATSSLTTSMDITQ